VCCYTATLHPILPAYFGFGSVRTKDCVPLPVLPKDAAVLREITVPEYPREPAIFFTRSLSFQPSRSQTQLQCSQSAMAPTKKEKEKTKTDLEHAIFKFKDKKEELLEVIGEPPDEQPLNAGLVNTTLIELSDKWEIVLSYYMNYVEIRGDEEEDRPAVVECTAKYKELRKSFVEIKDKVAKAVDRQVAARDQGEVVDQTELVQTELQATAYTRQVIEEEVCLVEQHIANLPTELSRETVGNQRVKPDKLSADMESRLLPHLQRQIELEPLKREELQSDHRAFVKNQLSKISLALNVLFEKQAKTLPVTGSATLVSNTQVRAPPRLQLEKLKVPSFDGDHTKWLLFKSKFKDIVATGAGYDDTAQGHILRDIVPKEAQERIEHVKLASEMMVILDKIYGDLATSVSIIVNKLLSLRLKKTTDYDQVIELCAVINRYCVVLSSLSTDAANHVKYNTNLLAHLVNLLPGTYEDKWYDHVVSQSSILNKWDIFTNWLKDMEKKANAQKLSRLGVDKHDNKSDNDSDVQTDILDQEQADGSLGDEVLRNQNSVTGEPPP
jgi:hypothetical protein